jgi:hypothetical protein
MESCRHPADLRKIHQALFKYGGWTAPYGDEVGGKVVQKELSQPDRLSFRQENISDLGRLLA